jgi:hypothetical protein
MVELYLHSPIRLHGIVLDLLIKRKDNFTFLRASGRGQAELAPLLRIFEKKRSEFKNNYTKY